MRATPDVPFSPARLPFFYGWVIAVAATAGTLMSIPGQTMGVSVFTDHLLAALTLSRIQVSEAYLFGTVASSFTLPLAGRLYDRTGARFMVVLASLSLAATLVYLSRCDAIARAVRSPFALSREARTLVELAVLSIGFYLLRFWGQGVLTMISRVMLGKWFHARRGLVMGASGVAVSAAFSMAPVVLGRMVDRWGWRGAWIVLAAILALGMAPLGWLLYRDTPEECGLAMDGAAPEPGAGESPEGEPAASSEASAEASGEASGANPSPAVDFSLGEAIRTYPFWIFNLALALPALVGTAMTFHIVDLGRRAGLDRDASLAVFPLMAVFSIGSNLAGGWLSDRIRVKYLLWVLVTMQALACAGLLHFGSPAGRWLAIVGFGVSGGLFALLMGVIWPRFFGRTHLGSISSVNMSVIVFASAVGPWLFALSDRLTGRYDSALIGCATLALGCLAAAIGLTNPQRRSARR